MKVKGFCVAAAVCSLAFFTAGCAGGKPRWVDRGTTDKPEKGVLYGMGTAMEDLNPNMQLTTARTQAMRELANSINAYVTALVKDFMQSHKDFADPSAASSIQFVSTVAREVSEATVRGAQQEDSWKDPQDKMLYVLYSMPVSAIQQDLADKAALAAARQESAAFGAKTDEALKSLDTFMKDKAEQEKK